MRRLLPLATLLMLSIAGLHAQTATLDCGQPADVRLSSDSPANVAFPGSPGDSIYIRLLASGADPGFSRNPPVVVDQFSNPYTPRPVDPTVAGATPSDMAGAFVGENYIGLEYDLRAESTYTLRLTSSNASDTNIPTV
jgi:hypothetical protein